MKIIKIDDGFEIKNTIYDKENFFGIGYSEELENFSKHIGKLVCRHGAKPCNKETELLGTLKASITTT